MNNKNDNIKNEQETYLKFYHYALEQFSQGNFEVGKRAIVCAVGTLFNITNEVQSDVCRVYIEKAKSLLEKCAKVSPISYRGMFESLEDMAMGLHINLNECTDLFKEADSEMDKVAGLENVKEEIKRQIVYPFKYPTIYKRFNKKGGGGILLYGLPGTGKTMIARAIAKDINADFYPVKCSDLLSKWFGESEGKINELFDKARNNSKSIIFFDEFEALGTRRSNNKSDAMNRVVHELLNQMDGFYENENTNLVVLAATNRPWDVDTAFLRPGRFNRKIHVPLPNEIARKKLIQMAFDKVPVSEDFNEECIVEMTQNYSGADTVEFCECAKMYAIEREIQSKKKTSVEMKDIESARKAVNTSITEFDVKAMEDYIKANNNLE